jgi:hypothetical protein
MAALIEARRGQGKIQEARGLLGQLFLLNPGGLPTRGWGLPVQFGVFGDEAQRVRWRTALETFAGQTGWDAAAATREGVEWSLDIRAEAPGASWTLRDPEGKVFRSGVVKSGPLGSLKAAAELFRQIHNASNSGTEPQG